MKNLGYWLLKLWIKTGLHLYYGKIKISGLENVPKDEPVLFLPNHQGALMDVLLIVTDCRRKPFFLTRSDVFKRPALKKFFGFLRMLPIYRIRDGRESLKKNRAVFGACTQLFHEKHALVMFPEANHNLKRRIRPLSKGFIRIVFNTLEKHPESAIQIVPVGMNYRSNTGFPDKVTVHYGRTISTKGMYKRNGGQNGVNILKDTVSDSLKSLTTHIADESNYATIVQELDARQVDYLNPTATNATIKSGSLSNGKRPQRSRPKVFRTIFKAVFMTLNFPVIFAWRTWIKPKVWEPEFTATLRFGFALLGYPLYYLLLFSLIAVISNGVVGLAVIVGLFLFNWGYVRWN